MNKGLLKIALLSMVCASMPAAITSCKDYDDDIDNLDNKDKDLQAQITAIQATVESLKSQAQEALTNANNAAAAAKAAQDAAEAAAQEAKAAKEYATSAAAQAKADALAEVAEQLKGYTTKAEYDALQARVKALEEKLAQGGTTTPGTSYDEALQALQTQLNALNQYKDLLENLKNKEAFINGLDQTITEINSAIAGLQNQASNFDTLLQAISNKVAAIEGSLVTINGDQLRSLVFNPVFYYHGIEAMWAPTWGYENVILNAVNADGNFATDAPVYKDSVFVTPDLVATYHMNPSTAQMPGDVKAYSFTNTIKHADFVRASGVPTPTIYEAKVNGGDVTVKANLKDGILPYIATDSKVTVLALEVSLGDTVITSDYAALKPVYQYGFQLADARKAAHQPHLYTTMAEAIANEPFATVAWNSEGVNIAEWVDTHYATDASRAAGNDIRWDENATKETVRTQGFNYEYALVGYKLGDNKTSESAHAALKVEGYDCTFRPQMTQDGKQQAFGSAQGMASIDRLPIVRVALKDTISGKYAAVGYIKIQIVPDTKEDEYTIIDPFTFDNAYTAACPLQTFKESLTWWQVEEKIIEKLGISKQEFEEQYEPDYTATKDPMTGETDTYLLKQFDKADKGAKEIAKANWIGEVGKTEYDDQPSETNVIKWNIGGEQAYNLFVDQKLTSTKVIVRFVKTYTVSMGSNHTQTVHHYVYVTLNWTPKALNVTPSGTISDNLKIAEMWYTAWTNQHGGFDETHLNVAVPKSENATSADCTYESHLLYPWKQEMKLAVSEIADVYLPGYADVNLTKTFSFKSEQVVTTATGVSGAEYLITVDGQTLKATSKVSPTEPAQAVAVIKNPTTSYTTWGTDDPTIEYQQTAYAKDILNAYDHNQLLKGQTPTGTIQITALNKCDKPIALTNNVFNVRFLRPINMEIKDGATMIDAVNEGSVVDLAEFISFTDWRSNDPMSFFSTHPWYFTYYGLQSFTVGKINPAYPSTILDPKNSGSLREVATTTLGGGTLGVTTLASVTPNIDLIFKPAVGSLTNYNMGELIYYNNGENINQAFQIEVPLVLTYKWGFLAGKLLITVKPTPGQGN